MRRIAFRLDGKLIGQRRGRLDARAARAGRPVVRRYSCATRRRVLRPGRHRLTVIVTDHARRRGRASVRILVPKRRDASKRADGRPPAPERGSGRQPGESTPSPSPSPTPPPASAAPNPGPASPFTTLAWSADLSTGDFTQWSWWGQGQSDVWGRIAVVDPASHGVPAPPVGSPRHVARMEVTAQGLAEGRYHAKLFKWWRGTPADVSGSYRAWYFIPADYALSGEAWSNVFQFKERSGGTSDPLWWVQLGGSSWARRTGGRWNAGERIVRGDQPVAFLNRWNNDWKRQVVFQPVPLGRWFEIRADLYQGDRMEVYVDGQLLDVARASEYPVSPFASRSEEWIFGAGNYAMAPDSVLYLGQTGYWRR